MKKLKYGDIVLFGYAKGGGLKENIVIWVGRKYAIIRDIKMHPRWTYQDVKVEISELIKSTKGKEKKDESK